MTSQSSKVLPFLGIAVGLIATFATLVGYSDQVDKLVSVSQAIGPLVLPASTIPLFGGLINKALETRRSVIDASSVQEATNNILAELQKAKESPQPST
jgi:hypothetical protein